MPTYFYAWRDDGMRQTINHHLVMTAHEAEGHEAGPSAGVIDNQSVKTTENGGVRGFDAGKKVDGRKRHIVVDTLGLLIAVMVHITGIQDHDGVPGLSGLDPKGLPLATPYLRRRRLRRPHARGRAHRARPLDAGDC